MLKISDADIGKLQDAAVLIGQCLDECETIAERAREEMAATLADADRAREEAEGIIAEASGDAEEYYDEKSEKWMESERGQIYSDWKTRLENLRDELSSNIEAPEIAEVDRPDWLAELENAGDLAQPEF